MFSSISCIISDADPCIKQVPNAFHTVSDCLVINWVECYAKEQEILPVNIRGQTRKAYLPICCLRHSLVTLAFRKWQADTRAGGNGSMEKGRNGKVSPVPEQSLLTITRAFIESWSFCWQRALPWCDGCRLTRVVVAVSVITEIKSRWK